jgi:hypothetical protein
MLFNNVKLSVKAARIVSKCGSHGATHAQFCLLCLCITCLCLLCLCLLCLCLLCLCLLCLCLRQTLSKERKVRLRGSRKPLTTTAAARELITILSKNLKLRTLFLPRADRKSGGLLTNGSSVCIAAYARLCTSTANSSKRVVELQYTRNHAVKSRTMRGTIF